MNAMSGAGRRARAAVLAALLGSVCALLLSVGTLFASGETDESESNLCASFAASEAKLNQIWKLLRERLSEEAYAAQKREQKTWLAERPARARELASKQGVSQCEAYALVNLERVEHFERLLPRAQKPSLGEGQDFRIIPRDKAEAPAPGDRVRYKATVQGYVGYAELRGMGYYAFFDRGEEKCFIAPAVGVDAKLLDFLKRAAEKKRLAAITGVVEENEHAGCSLDAAQTTSFVFK
jgi:hypothetical protein